MSPADTTKLAALKNLEPDLTDVTYMADIACETITEAFARLDLHRELAGGKPDLYYLTHDQLDRILFSVRHAHQMVKDLETKFLTIFDGPGEAGEEVHP